MNADDPLEPLLQRALELRASAGQKRQRVQIEHLSATRVRIAGRELINFCSNDYLGLSRHPKIAAAMRRAIETHGSGAGASALISGYTPSHASAERAIAKWKGTESAVLVPSGYQANHAAIQAIAGASEAAGGRVRFLLDKLVHASLIDAVRASGQTFRVFPHNDLKKLTRLLDDADAGEMQVVVTESIFSMDGDAAPLAGFAKLKAEKLFVLVLDEAHAAGVYGESGAGYASELGLSASVDAYIVTLSKALGLAGGAICGSRAICELIANFGRAYIYSTSIPPAIAAGAEAGIQVLHDEPELRQRVRSLAQRVRSELESAALQIPQGDSPIIPIVLGDERLASEAAKTLEMQGILAFAIRPPTVAKGTSRLRVTLSAAHTDDEIAQLIAALTQLKAL